ncbi:ATP-binding response regulator [Ensifer soli]|uniref:ATP-binding response regulator n=1 Tax=Ciceribacter sp. sgz301302 TaxID=3342379 RepID=UPI0035B6B2C0
MSQYGDDDQRFAFETLAAIGHGVALWSAEGRLRLANPAFRRRFDAFPGGLEDGIAQPLFLDAVERSGLIVSSGQPPADPLGPGDLLSGRTLIFSDGAIFTIDGFATANGDLVTLCRDVTEATRNARALEKARETAQQADHMKSRFLRAANHDLRQPLASLKILIYTCITALTDEERAQALHAMDVSVQIMEDLLGALLNIGQLDAGRVTPTIQTFQLSSILDRLKLQFDHQAREKGLTLTILPSKAAIESDRALLERILANFLGNAIRYTDLGRVLVGCRRHGKTLRIGVYDTGCGIDPRFHEAIFDEFFRVGGEQRDRQHSLGLGLNIAKRLADVIGHPVRVDSAPGRGSTFSIDVPLGDILYSNVGEPEINERIGGEFAGLACLVLEDDVYLRSALTALLERWGIRVLTIDSFDDIAATVGALEATPDIIISDYRLRGGVEGPDVVGAINDLLEQPCPAIVVTADTNPALIQSIRDQGYPVMIKPVSPPGLRVIMHNILFEPELVPEIA